jgi:hypothetical protein
VLRISVRVGVANAIDAGSRFTMTLSQIHAPPTNASRDCSNALAP